MRTLHFSNTRGSPLRPSPKPEPHPTASPPDSALRRGLCPTDELAPNVFNARTQTLPWMWLQPDHHPWRVVQHGFWTPGLRQADEARTQKEAVRLAAPGMVLGTVILVNNPLHPRTTRSISLRPTRKPEAPPTACPPRNPQGTSAHHQRLGASHIPDPHPSKRRGSGPHLGLPTKSEARR